MLLHLARCIEVGSATSLVLQGASCDGVTLVRPAFRSTESLHCSPKEPRSFGLRSIWAHWQSCSPINHLKFTSVAAPPRHQIHVDEADLPDVLREALEVSRIRQAGLHGSQGGRGGNGPMGGMLEAAPLPGAGVIPPDDHRGARAHRMVRPPLGPCLF